MVGPSQDICEVYYIHTVCKIQLIRGHHPVFIYFDFHMDLLSFFYKWLQKY